MTEHITIWSLVRTQLFVTIAVLAGLLAIGTVAFHYLENWSWITSFYFAVSTVTTVGYGDLYPTTDVSRLFTAIFALVGVAIALVALGALGAKYLNMLHAIATNASRGRSPESKN